MHILEVIEFLTPEKGGSVESVRLLSRQLSAMGHSVTVCTSDYHLDGLPANENFEVIAFRVRSSFSNFFFTPSLIPWARRHLREFDVVHLNNFHSFQNAVVSHYARKYRVPYVLSARGSSGTDWGKKYLKKAYDLAAGNRMVSNAAWMHALSKMEKAQYETRGVSPDKIKLVPNGINLFRIPSSRGQFRHHFNIDNDDKVVLFLGRLQARKRVDLLIRAFHLLTRQMSSVKLAIVGPDDGHLSFLKEQVRVLDIGDKVMFTGPLFGEDKVQAYCDSDVFVSPSANEIFDRTILESWACGCPVIAVEWHGALDWVSSDTALVAENGESGLCDALARLLGDENERQRRSEAGRKAAAEIFGMDKIGRQFEQMFFEMAGDERARTARPGKELSGLDTMRLR